jgi:hypothetical protein
MRNHHDVHLFNQSRDFVSSCAAALMHSPSKQFLVLLTKNAANPFPKFSIFLFLGFVSAPRSEVYRQSLQPWMACGSVKAGCLLPIYLGPRRRPNPKKQKRPTPYGIGFQKFSLKQPAMPLEPQKVTWAPYDHFRLLTQLNGQHAHHDTGTAPWVMTVGSRCLLLVPQAVYRIPNFRFLANIFLWKLYNKY